jgi:hypothetical protein
VSVLLGRGDNTLSAPVDHAAGRVHRLAERPWEHDFVPQLTHARRRTRRLQPLKIVLWPIVWGERFRQWRGATLRRTAVGHRAQTRIASSAPFGSAGDVPSPMRG